MTEQDDDFDRLLRDARVLTPEQRDLLVRRAIERARAHRAAAIRALFRRWFDWIKRRAAIARLRTLDDRMLKDIGIHRSEIDRAVRGPDRRPGEPSLYQASVMTSGHAPPLAAHQGVRAPRVRMDKAA